MSIFRFRLTSWQGLTGLVALGVVMMAIPGSASQGFEPGLEQSVALYQGAAESPELWEAVQAAVAQGVDQNQLQILIREAKEGNLPAATLIAWVQRTEQLGQKQLPVSPVLSRYLQGLAKGVPVARIDAVVDELEGRLEEAAWRVDAVVDASDDPAARHARLVTIDHGAYALGLGVPANHLDHSISLAWDDSRSIEEIQAPVLTLGILVASGISVDKSMEVVDAAWVHGYRGSSLERLGKALGRLGGEGDGPSAEVVNEVLEMIGSDATQDRVFQGLDELIGREGYRLSGTMPVDDPTIRRGDPGKRALPDDQSPNKDDDQLRLIGNG
jgi:hypothetical protein